MYLLRRGEFAVPHEHLGELVDYRVVALAEVVGDFELFHVREGELVTGSGVGVG